uniref:Uncharacterized protein n=1 Tax=Lotus japonicus TaxID=34305 RepID=I3S5P6_LOTJA|nr:unknown [Lotus japonicus]
MKESAELAEPDLQVDQTARSDAPSSCRPSCGSTERRVLSNQVS